jgi:hydrogenase expression/formation protein HypE
MDISCPIAFKNYPQILLAHGGGGKLMQQLITQMFLAVLGKEENQHDSTVIELPASKIAFTTDSYVINPLFFPGGDIASLAVYGTVNDLAMSGALPLYLSVGFILEEGLPMDTLWQIVRSLARAAKIAGVKIVTGDTKVVDQGKGDGIFINTSGVGVIKHNLQICPHSVQPRDVILINGDIGRHGMAIMAVREGLEFETEIKSDCAPLSSIVLEMLDQGMEIHCLRDATRGGLASILNEIADSANICLEIDENSIPVREDVQGACEIFGFDPLYVANEGKFVTFIPEKFAQDALAILHKYDKRANIIGMVKSVDGSSDDGPGKVFLKSKIGVKRILDLLTGEQLPRIC